jgi:hypothetical protein
VTETSAGGRRKEISLFLVSVRRVYDQAKPHSKHILSLFVAFHELHKVRLLLGSWFCHSFCFRVKYVWSQKFVLISTLLRVCTQRCRNASFEYGLFSVHFPSPSPQARVRPVRNLHPHPRSNCRTSRYLSEPLKLPAVLLTLCDSKKLSSSMRAEVGATEV